MNSYRSHIVDVLIESICISKAALYVKSGMEDKRKFTSEIDDLIEQKRIRYESDIHNQVRVVLSPKILKLAEIDKESNELKRVFKINYVPTQVLEKVLEYVNPGIDPFEDSLDFHLEVMGYKIDEKYKAFFERENDFILDFVSFHYDLWAEYLFLKYEDLEQNTVHI